MNKKKERLIKIADFLDRHKNEEDADFITSLIAEDSDIIEVPKDELELLKLVQEALQESLS